MNDQQSAVSGSQAGAIETARAGTDTAALVGQTQALLQSLPVDPYRRARAIELAAILPRRLGAADLALINPPTLAGAALSALEAVNAPHAAEGVVVVGNPAKTGPAEAAAAETIAAELVGPWETADTVVLTVNEDMPFLVASVTAELNRRALSLRLVLHPVLRLTFATDGRVAAIAENGPVRLPAADNERVVSLIIVLVERQTEAEVLEDIRLGLQSVLADVAAAVRDWQPMKVKVATILAELAAAPPPLPPAERADATALLRWIDGDHFTFLGYREYRFVGSAAGASDEGFEVVAPSGLGLLRDAELVLFDGLRQFAGLPPAVQDVLRSPQMLLITKASHISTVHRRAPLDAVFVKRVGSDGRIVGSHVFVGLFTSSAYSQSALEIPVLRRKIEQVLARSSASAESHDGKALLHILETYPRDELLQAREDELLKAALGILDLQHRQRLALFVRRDVFERSVSCLVYIPQDRYTTKLRERVVALIEQGFAGTATAASTRMGDEPFARLLVMVKVQPGSIETVDVAALERQIVDAGRSWQDGVRDGLVAAHGEIEGGRLFRRYGLAFPASYEEQYPSSTAVADIHAMELVRRSGRLAVRLAEGEGAEESGLIVLTIVGAERPLPLSDILPVLENMGLRIVGEHPHIITLGFGVELPNVYCVQRLTATAAEGIVLDLRHGVIFEEAIDRIWRRDMEDDGFNALILGAGLAWRQISVLRAYAKYLRQATFPFSQEYVERALARNPAIASDLIDLFTARFDPDHSGDRAAAMAAIEAGLASRLDAIASIDEDRILRAFLAAIRGTLRTNAYQRRDGRPRPTIALKLDSKAMPDLPKPRPYREIFVCSPTVEAIHLRGGPVARGGLRWSDRREDFRTEVLSLMKAQMVKNTVIVPVGSKGGFVVKRPPPLSAGRDALQREGISCYRAFIRSLLDITDNLTPAGVVPPEQVVRYDGDDPYLVVAADKGTATFSDIANAISREYGFWLDDAFASGGSAGYDHKKMGITARGAWESVKRHFLEMGRDIQSADFTCVGIGDMAGDVFGNGMLLSRHLRLVGAFNHQHIFIDPEPDAATSFAERQRLFALPRSSWADYDRALISSGGGLFERSAKTIPVSPEMAARFRLDGDRITPTALIRTLLTAPVDLLYLGGIGTYVKASDETDGDAGDRINDPLRINGRELRAAVVAEGANLGFTQRGRIEYAATGGRINTDFIDNSAGVDCSDHEVNIKILLADAALPPAEGGAGLKREDRDLLLATMTDEVAALVLTDNFRNALAISLQQQHAPALLDAHARFIRKLERSGRLDRALEALPDEEEIAERRAAGRGLTRPELAVLLAYAKMELYEALLATELPDDPLLEDDLRRYFPRPLQERYPEAIRRHRLRREIVATHVTNSIINRAGATFAAEMAERTGCDAGDVARAYTLVRDLFGLREIWMETDALTGLVPPVILYGMIGETQRLVDRAVSWFLRHCAHPIPVTATQQMFAPGVERLKELMDGMISEENRAVVARRVAALEEAGVPKPLARRVASLTQLSPAMEIIRVAKSLDRDIAAVGGVYLRLGERFGFDWLRREAARLPRDSHWQEMATTALVEDLVLAQTAVTEQVLRHIDAAALDLSAEAAVEGWLGGHRGAAAHASTLVDEMRRHAGSPDLAMLTVATRALHALAEG